MTSIVESYFEWYLGEFEPDPPNEDAVVCAYIVLLGPLDVFEDLVLALDYVGTLSGYLQLPLIATELFSALVTSTVLLCMYVFRKRRFHHRERAHAFRFICTIMTFTVILFPTSSSGPSGVDWLCVVEYIFLQAYLGFYVDVAVNCVVVLIYVALASYQRAYNIVTIFPLDSLSDNNFATLMIVAILGPLVETVMIPIQGQMRWTMVRHMQRELEVLTETCGCIAMMDLERAEAALDRVAPSREPTVVNALRNICINVRKYRPFLLRRDVTLDSNAGTETTSISSSVALSSSSSGSPLSNREHQRPVAQLYFETRGDHRVSGDDMSAARHTPQVYDDVAVLTVVLPDVDEVSEVVLNEFVYTVCRVVEQHGGVVLGYQGGRTVSYFTRGIDGAVMAATQIGAEGNAALGVTVHSGVDASRCLIGDLCVGSCGLAFREVRGPCVEGSLMLSMVAERHAAAVCVFAKVLPHVASLLKFRTVQSITGGVHTQYYCC